MVSNIIVVDTADARFLGSYCGCSGSTKYLRKTKVRDKTKTAALYTLTLVALLSFVILIYSGLRANLWLLIAGFGPLLTSGFAILRISAHSK